MDIPTVRIAVVSLAVRLKFKKVPEPVLILSAGAVGVMLRHGST